MKNTLLFLVAALGLLVTDANATTYYVDFGNNNLNGTGNYLMDGAANANTLNKAQPLSPLSIGSSGLTLSSSAELNGTGNGGTFIGGGGTNGVGTSTIPTDSTLLNNYKNNESLNKGWQDLASGKGESQAQSLTFSGLQANTTYTFTFLSIRANDGMTGTGTWGMSFSEEGNVFNQNFSMLGYNGQDATGAYTFNSATVESGIGKGAELTYSFTTGDVVPDSAMLNLSGNWNLNMAKIDIASVPEPTTASLGLLGLVLVAVRRRRA